MPPGTPYDSFLVEYPYIRVDDFTSNKNHQAKIHLLTHAHSDHIVGLQAKSFSQKIICSHDTKELLLRHEQYKARYLHEQKLRAEKGKTYSHLKVDPRVGENGEICYQGSKDLLKVVPLNTPYPIEIDGKRTVTVTLIDANHCPGSVMFLIEGDSGNVLHTGDVRAEPWFLETLKHNPYLRPYLAMPGSTPGVLKTLDAIYLDTACVFNIEEVPTKEDATTGLIALMRLLPPTTHFFLNAWTLGYEDILTAVASAFGSKIHTDRYKHSIHVRLEQEPLLRSVSSRDPATRFHACERFDRCEYCDVSEDGPADVSTKGTKVVYVNPVSTMNREAWNTYQTNTKRRLVAKENVTCLLVPLARHSPFPELISLVSLFKPKTIVPNTLDPSLDNLDWAGIHQAFLPALRGHNTSAPSTQSSDFRVLQDLTNDEEGMDVSLKNLVGDHAEELAKKWADWRGRRRILEVLKIWLGCNEPFPAGPSSVSRPEEHRDGYDSSSDVEEDGGRTMHKLLAPQLGIDVVESQVSSSPVARAPEPQLPSPSSSPPATVLAVKRTRPVSPSPAGPSTKRPRVQRTPSPLPRSSPNPSSPLSFHSPAPRTPRPVRSLTTPNLKGKGKAAIDSSSPTPVRTVAGRRLALMRPSPLKASTSAPVILRRLQVSQESSDHDSVDEDDRGTTADYLFGGIPPVTNDHSDEVVANSEPEPEPEEEEDGPVGNLLDDDAFDFGSSPARLRQEKTLAIAMPVSPTPKALNRTPTTTATVPSLAVPTPRKRTPLEALSVKQLQQSRSEISMRVKVMQRYNPGSPKLKELLRRDVRMSGLIEWREGRMALVKQKLDELVMRNETRRPDPFGKRVVDLTKAIEDAIMNGERVASVLPQLECIFGPAETQEMKEVLEELN